MLLGKERGQIQKVGSHFDIGLGIRAQHTDLQGPLADFQGLKSVDVVALDNYDDVIGLLDLALDVGSCKNFATQHVVQRFGGIHEIQDLVPILLRSDVCYLIHGCFGAIPEDQGLHCCLSRD